MAAVLPADPDQIRQALTDFPESTDPDQPGWHFTSPTAATVALAVSCSNASEAKDTLAHVRSALVAAGFAIRPAGHELHVLNPEEATPEDRAVPDGPPPHIRPDASFRIYRRADDGTWTSNCPHLFDAATVGRAVRQARREQIPVFPTPDGSIRIGLAAYRPV